MIVPNIWKNKIHVPNHQPLLWYFEPWISYENYGTGYEPVLNQLWTITMVHWL